MILAHQGSPAIEPCMLCSVRCLGPLVFPRPGHSPGAWAPTAFLSRALGVSLALGNAAKSGTGDTTSTKGPIDGINVEALKALSSGYGSSKRYLQGHL